MSTVWHLVRRFFDSLWPRNPDREAEAWLASLLSVAEWDLYTAQTRVDRRHSVRCAVAARTSLGPRADTPTIVAAALHDVGKADARLGTFGRVGATLLGAAWPGARRRRGRVGSYLRHPERGAELLAAAGSAPIVVAWAREHHLAHDEWTVDPALGRVLRSVD